MSRTTTCVQRIFAWQAGQSKIMRWRTDLPGLRWWTIVVRLPRPGASQTRQRQPSRPNTLSRSQPKYASPSA